MPLVPLFVWLVVAALSAFWIAFGSLIIPGARSGDFLNLYTGAHLALEGNFTDLHNIDTQLQQERRIVPGLPALRPFVRPAFYALLLAPLALLPYQAAFICWLTAQTLLLAGCFAWALRRFGPMRWFSGFFTCHRRSGSLRDRTAWNCSSFLSWRMSWPSGESHSHPA